MDDSDLSRLLDCLREFGSQFSTLSSQLAALNGKVEALAQRGVAEGEPRPVDRDLKAKQPRFTESDRDRSLREVASGIAHNFNNILAIIVGQTQLMLKQVGDPSAQKRLETIEEAASRAAEMVRRLQSFATPGEGDAVVPVDLNTVIQDALAGARPRWREAEAQGLRCEVATDLGELPPILGNPAELCEMMLHLLSNAIEAMPAGGQVVVTSRHAGNLVELSISDSGVGIPEKIRSRIFDPFFTTKSPRHSGLGLSVVQGIAARHRAEVEVSSEEGKGTTFALRLPVGSEVRGVQTAPTPTPERLAKPPRPARVLLDKKIQASGAPPREPVNKSAKKNGAGRLLFIVSPDRADLYNYLTWQFSGEKDVEVILGRREKDFPQAGEWNPEDDVFGLNGVITRYVEGEESVAADPTRTSPGEEPGGPSGGSKSLRGKTILVVDDEPMLAKLVAQILSLDGYEVETAPNGAVGLNKLQEREYDLILCDLKMPELDGESLYREVTRRNPELGRRFVFLTGSAATSETRHFLEHSGPPHLTKPFDMETLRRVVQRTLAAAEDAAMVRGAGGVPSGPLRELS